MDVRLAKWKFEAFSLGWIHLFTLGPPSLSQPRIFPAALQQESTFFGVWFTRASRSTDGSCDEETNFEEAYVIRKAISRNHGSKTHNDNHDQCFRCLFTTSM